MRGVVTDILPSRLKRIASFNGEFKLAQSPAFPEVHLLEFDFDLSLSCLRPLLHRPGGKKAKSRNESRRLFDLRRDIAAAVYHDERLPWERFRAELHETAQWHWDAASEGDGASYKLLHEGFSKKGEHYLTPAGWVRHAARFLHYCRLIRGETVTPYRPTSELLQPYFGPETGIDSPAKAFAFVLGILYGKLISVQGARGQSQRRREHADLVEAAYACRQGLCPTCTSKSAKRCWCTKSRVSASVS